MDPLFSLTERLPAPAGSSPFHVRGAYYLRLLQRARTLPGGLKRLREELVDDSVRSFIEQRFTWNGWYDVMPTMPLYVAASRMEGVDFETHVKEATRRAAHELVPSVLRIGFRWAGPSAFRGKVLTAVRYADDFTRVTLDEPADGRSSGIASGIPRLVAPNTANLALGFFMGMLELAGAVRVSASYTDVALDGEVAGYETVAIRYVFSWRR